MPHIVDPHLIQADFDRLALLSTENWNHNSHYHSFLLKHIPSPCRDALEIGCGTGTFARLLARHAERVLALDLSPQMIRIARERSAEYPNIDFRVANVMEWEFPAERFDCIVSIATLHHLPLDEMLTKMKSALKVNGCLIVLDLFQAEGLLDVLCSMIAIPVNIVLKWIKNGRIRDSREVRAAWAEHGQRDSYLTVSEVRRICEAVLPRAQVRKHLFWRYSIVCRAYAF